MGIEVESEEEEDYFSRDYRKRSWEIGVIEEALGNESV